MNFRVFDKPTTIKGFAGYGTTYFGNNEVREPEDQTSFDVKAGSIILNLIDQKTGQVVWRGLASGLTNNNGFDRDHNKIKQAINPRNDPLESKWQKWSSRHSGFDSHHPRIKDEETRHQPQHLLMPEKSKVFINS